MHGSQFRKTGHSDFCSLHCFFHGEVKSWRLLGITLVNFLTSFALSFSATNVVAQFGFKVPEFFASDVKSFA